MYNNSCNDACIIKSTLINNVAIIYNIIIFFYCKNRFAYKMISLIIRPCCNVYKTACIIQLLY